MVLTLIAFGGYMKVEYKDIGNSGKDGVYRIVNIINQRVYYGSCKQFKRRFLGHRNSLLANKHGNRFLQADFNKCGSEAFVFEVIEVIAGSKEDRVAREQQYITQYFDNGDKCYNLRKNACDSREGQGNTKTTDPLTDGRCQKPSQEVLVKRAIGLKQAFIDNPELRDACAARAKEIRWKNYIANATVTHEETGEVIVIQGSLREWCLQRNLSYKSFHQLVKGKIKSSGGWFLGTEKPAYVSQKGQKDRKSTRLNSSH